MLCYRLSEFSGFWDSCATVHIECGDLVAWFMPRQSEWLLRLPAIRSELEALSVPVVDRSIFEKVFGVRRRRAIQLMHRFGGFQSGKTFWIERSSLLRQLESLEASGEVSSDLRRRERLSSQLDQVRQYARAARVPIAAAPERVCDPAQFPAFRRSPGPRQAHRRVRLPRTTPGAPLRPLSSPGE